MSFRLAALTALTSAAMLAAPAAQAARLYTYKTEAGAHRHCPHDQVVWLNTKSGVYHLRGQRGYATTKGGAFVCRMEANAHHARPSANGQ